MLQLIWKKAVEEIVMIVRSFKATSDSKISSQINLLFPVISYNSIMKLLRNKDVRINGKKVAKDIVVNAGDEITFYINEEIFESRFKIVYEDENIVVVFKNRKIEVCSSDETVDTVESLLSQKLNQKCYAVHRLDMNTIGLVVFAKNLEAKKLLDESFKTKTMEKFYLALVYSKPHKEKDYMIAFLKKDENNAMVKISDIQQSGYDKIVTIYSLLNVYEDFSLVEVKLLTGKTLQIRAHFAHIGHPILGDDKYGETHINKKYKLKSQCLCSYKLIFHFEEDCLLHYLNDKVVELDRDKIDFLSLTNS